MTKDKMVVQADKALSPYDILVSEYYSESHKTSRNFDQVSLELLAVWKGYGLSGQAIELGCGKGRAAEYLGVKSEQIIQTDSSEKMLELYPREPSSLRVRCDARNTPFLKNTFSAAFAFLFDPFNETSFYKEVFRILKDDAVFIGTLPAYTWGLNLRNLLNIPINSTRFTTKKGDLIKAPSFLSTDDEILYQLKNAGFSSIEIITGKLNADTKVISPDICSGLQT